MRHLTLLCTCLVSFLVVSAVGAQPGHPIVMMTVEPGGEKMSELSAR